MTIAAMAMALTSASGNATDTCGSASLAIAKSGNGIAMLMTQSPTPSIASCEASVRNPSLGIHAPAQVPTALALAMHMMPLLAAAGA